MALTTLPENTDSLSLKSQRDIRCSECGTRRTIDMYDEPTVASCIGENCGCFFVIPKYPSQNSAIEAVESRGHAKRMYKELLET